MHSESRRYLGEYDQTLALQWDQLMGWKDRESSEGACLIDLMRSHRVNTIFDAAAGTGFHTVLLANAAFNVTAMDGAEQMVSKARQNIAALVARPIACNVGDWLQADTMPAGPFDAVICLGNSLAHLFSAADLELALSNFRKLLRRGGVLIIDHRNYDGIIAGKVSGRSRTYCCTGLKSSVEMTVVEPDVVEISYTTAGHPPSSIRTHAWKVSDIAHAVAESGFVNHHVYGEKGGTFDPDTAEFVIHVATAGDM